MAWTAVINGWWPMNLIPLWSSVPVWTAACDGGMLVKVFDVRKRDPSSSAGVYKDKQGAVLPAERIDCLVSLVRKFSLL